MSVDVAQRRLLEAIAGVHHGRRADNAIEAGDPLAALALGVALARFQAGFDGDADGLLSPVLGALEALVLAVRDDLVQWTELPPT